MKNKNTYWIIAGILNLFTSILHLIGGQIDLINPLFKSNLSNQIKTELLGVWHMATVILFASSFIFIKQGFAKAETNNFERVAFISYLYLAFSVAFIFSSIYYSTLAPQWILLFPIGLLGVLGIKKAQQHLK